MAKYNYNLSISEEESNITSVVRVVAMFLIVGCHLCNVYPEIEFMGQILNVGVYVFFILSGFLYGQRDIKSAKRWLKARFVRILAPVYIFYIIMFLLLLLVGKLGSLNLKSVLLQIFNLQGFVDCAEIGNVYTGHLWYISFILLCYLITPILQRLRGNMSGKMALLVLIIISIIESIVICNVKIQSFIAYVSGIIAYISAYFLGAYWNKLIEKKRYALIFALMIFAMLIRLYVKKNSDMDVKYGIIYERVITQYTHIILAYWIFMTLYALCQIFKEIVKKTIAFVKFFDSISFEIYIVHQVLCIGTLSVMKLTNSVFVNMVIFTVLTVMTAFLLHKLSLLTLSMVSRK